MKQKQFLLFVLLLIGALSGTGHAQRKSGSARTAGSAAATEGVLYFVGSGNGLTECILLTETGRFDFDATNKTRYTGFHPDSDDDAGWHLGARWQITYHRTKTGTVADSIAYLGEIKLIAEAEKLGRSFLDALSDQDFKAAYDKLSPEAKHHLPFARFTDIYKDRDISMRGTIICSQSESAVQILLAPHGADGGDLFQTAEIVQIGNTSVIARLGDFSETADDCLHAR